MKSHLNLKANLSSIAMPQVKPHYITQLRKAMVCPSLPIPISTADLWIGDTAVALLKAGAETDKKDVDGKLALELAPDAQVMLLS